MSTNRAFGSWLRQLRTARDLTQERFADVVGCAPETIRSFEAGRRRPSLGLARRLADILDLPPDERELFVRAARAETEPEQAEPPRQLQPVAVRPWSRPEVHLPAGALIGRRREIEGLRRALLDEGRRLVTILGPGGIGKTRLALQVAADLASDFADRAAIVSLAPVESPDHMVMAVAEALGCPLPGGQVPEDALIAFLRPLALLLTLDNLEHLLVPPHGARVGALLTRIVREAPGVQLLVTSRERLKLRDEWVAELAPLAVPDDDPARAIDRSEAVLLFLERARHVTGDFALTRANRGAIASICRLLGGVPLAIELAASWTRALTCEEIAAEVGRGLDFLAQEDRDLPPRHQSLRAVIDHSWRLLTSAEQQLLMRLSAFRGGCRREAVDAVAGESGTATLALLAALVDKSLVRRSAENQGTTRYDLHELVRQYAAARHAETPAASAASAARHAAYYAAWVARQDGPLKSGTQRATVQAITAEIDNVRAAWGWACAERDASLLGQMILTLDWFYELRGWHAEGAAAFVQGSQALCPHGEPAPEPGDLHRSYWLMIGREGWHTLRRDPRGAARKLQTAVERLRAVDDRGSHLHCIKGLAYLRMFAGDYAGAEATLDEALALAGDDRWQRAVVHVVRGVLEVLRSDPATARRYLETALAAARACGDPRNIALTLNYLGLTALALEETDKAEQVSRECLVLAAEGQDRFQMSLALQSMGQVALARGDVASATWLFDEGLTLARTIDDRWLISQALGHQGALAAQRGDRARAGELLREALAVAVASPVPHALDALYRLADLELPARPEAALTALAYVRRHHLSRPATRAAAEARWRDAEGERPELLGAAQQAAEQLPLDQPVALLQRFEQ